MKKGFTLLELLAVIVLIGLIGLIATPIIISVVNNAKKDSFLNVAHGIKRAAEMKYIDIETSGRFQPFTIDYVDGVENLSLSGETLDYDGQIPKNGRVKIDAHGRIALAFHDGQFCVEKGYESNEITISKKTEENCKLPYNDLSGAAMPELANDMIPIKWDGSKWVKANIFEEWYDYEKKEWANAVLVSNTTRNTYKNAEPRTSILETDVLTYLVWVPRYRYKLFNVGSLEIEPKEIEILFEDNETVKSNGIIDECWLTHPAFTFGSKEVNGFWVGKFETSGDEIIPTIKPGVTSLINQNLKTQFNTAKKFNNEIIYGLTSTYNAHMMKNTEWGAVAYLSHSKYGINREININGSTSLYTGGGLANSYVVNINQTTTGNIYGIYDMSGGSWDRVMAGMLDASETRLIAENSGFSELELTLGNPSFIGEKYIDIYGYGEDNNLTRQKIGDATGETNNWYSDLANFIVPSDSWLLRGGDYAGNINSGIFAFLADDFENVSFRLVVSSLD